MKKKIKTIIDSHLRAVKDVTNDIAAIEAIVRKIKACLRSKNKLLICGNGGSAADAQHMAAEFVGRFLKKRGPLAAVALTTDTSVLTSVGNDFGFEKVFSKQVEALGKRGDILIAISTSGNSPNLIDAVKAAKKKKMVTIGILGRKGGRLKTAADLSFVARSDKTPRIQEIHSLVIHAVCELSELTGR